eukprot:11201335-Lingulodinium_polyedra.AAC.1
MSARTGSASPAPQHNGRAKGGGQGGGSDLTARHRAPESRVPLLRPIGRARRAPGVSQYRRTGDG